jgi:hypothetical protein
MSRIKDAEYRNRNLLDLAHLLPCQNCGWENGGSEPAHSNSQKHGKGMSHKAHDCYFAALCNVCHSWLDQGSGKDPTGLYSDDRADKQAMWRHAFDRTLLELWRRRLIEVRLRA